MWNYDFVEFLRKEASLEVLCKPSTTSKQKDLCRKMMKSPVPDEKKFEGIWKNHVYPLRGQYTMTHEERGDPKRSTKPDWEGGRIIGTTGLQN